ncbi:type III-A CRISPR-associated RAMP protein Csm5 [Syntrophobacter fumaroxidans]|uniref:CRISPR system Cms protein Csm5 n=1 Tax=Syntrophobacter fumaroxidans (strain DSM 10017 / MPOB) TaxID=335543 RepID=A0LHY4_SYNFM|nr:type III-A CRISPR-associated RAMP protein Csm5 [Syntrophobacter fumaroxidans]ABK17036.1 CRISPR-associated protein, Csm5 family [Syntrophobacter fumaroxidans MPOB]
MSAYHFKAQALTPIHIGSGNEIDPLEFILEGNRLVRFNPADVVNGLSGEELRRYSQLVERADLKGIQAFLRTHLDAAHHDHVYVDVSKEFKRLFEEKASNPSNQFRVDMMPHNPHSGAVYLPGSSIKGAIRTAVINYFANIEPATKSTVHQTVGAEQNLRNKARILEESALDRRHSQTERDVLRLLDVQDVDLPNDATRIDRALNYNPQKQGSQEIQIWVERVKALADGGGAPQFEVTLHLDTAAMKHPGMKATLGRTLDFDTILRACNLFYWGRMTAEGEKFDQKKSGGKSWKALHELFPKGKTPDGQIVAIDPSKNYWCYPQRKRMLLRVGRFSHFESLSVDGLREGYNIQARTPIEDMGATRTRCSMENGRPAMPFGWLILTLERTL